MPLLKMPFPPCLGAWQLDGLFSGRKPLAMFSPAPLRNLTKGPQRGRSDDAMDSLLIRSYVRLALR